MARNRVAVTMLAVAGKFLRKKIFIAQSLDTGAFQMRNNFSRAPAHQVGRPIAYACMYK
jgi:hypothetical protein